MKNFTKGLLKPDTNVAKLTKSTAIDGIQAKKENKKMLN